MKTRTRVWLKCIFSLNFTSSKTRFSTMKFPRLWWLYYSLFSIPKEFLTNPSLCEDSVCVIESMYHDDFWWGWRTFDHSCSWGANLPSTRWQPQPKCCRLVAGGDMVMLVPLSATRWQLLPKNVAPPGGCSDKMSVDSGMSWESIFRFLSLVSSTNL